jgi:ATP-dependent DNA helicase RecQ
MNFPLRLQEEPVVAQQVAPMKPLGSDVPHHRELYESLKQLRREWAEQLKVPPFVIFHDQTLKEISRTLPVTLEELACLRGIGNGPSRRMATG